MSLREQGGSPEKSHALLYFSPLAIYFKVVGVRWQDECVSIIPLASESRLDEKSGTCEWEEVTSEDRALSRGGLGN